MGRLLEIARAYQQPEQAPPSVPARSSSGRIRLSDFATAGRIVRLWSDVLGQEVCFASDNADPNRLPPGVPVYWARELAALWGEDGQITPGHLRTIHQAKTGFDGGGEVTG